MSDVPFLLRIPTALQVGVLGLPAFAQVVSRTTAIPLNWGGSTRSALLLYPPRRDTPKVRPTQTVVPTNAGQPLRRKVIRGGSIPDSIQEIRRQRASQGSTSRTGGRIKCW